jgi:hypothetical protein
LDQLALQRKKIAILGGTGKAASFIHQFMSDSIRFLLVVDSDPQKFGTFVPGMEQIILSSAVLKNSLIDLIIIPTKWRANDRRIQVRSATRLSH